MVFLLGIAAACSTLLGGLFALHLKDRLHLILGFSAGAVIGVAFFDLMPQALQLFGKEQEPSVVTAIIALGFALYFLLDRLVVLHHHHGDEVAHVFAARGAWGAGTLSFHSFLDGIAIGLAFQVSVPIGLVVAAAVLTHDFSDGINTVSVILKQGGDRQRAFSWLILDAIAPILGVLTTLAISVSQESLGILIALFAGFFLYIGASDLLPESHHSHPVYWTTISTIAGMVLLYFIVQLAGV